jgi:hypothetical protein
MKLSNRKLPRARVQRLSAEIAQKDVMYPSNAWVHTNLCTSESTRNSIFKLIEEEIKRTLTVSLVRVQVMIVFNPRIGSRKRGGERLYLETILKNRKQKIRAIL